MVFGNSFGHCNIKAYAIQCSGRLGVSAMVQSGNVVCGGNESMVHSKQLVIRGSMNRACPENASVPPSIMGIILVGSISPSSSNVTKPTMVAFNHRRASMLSKPDMTT